MASVLLVDWNLLAADLRGPRPGAFRWERLAYGDPRLHNCDVVPLPQGGYRLYCHLVSSILTATSADGLRFVFDPKPVLAGAMPGLERLPDGRWRMYFAGPRGMESATSADGLNFQGEGLRLASGPAGSWDERGQIHLAPLRLPDGRLRMYYDAQASPREGTRSTPRDWRTTSALSEDGLAFRREPGLRIDARAMSQQPDLRERGTRLVTTWSVFPQYRDGVYCLYTTALCLPRERSGVWRATSTDGLHFTMDPEPSLSLEDLGGRMLPEDPFVVSTPEGERMYAWTAERGTLVAFRPWSEAPPPGQGARMSK